MEASLDVPILYVYELANVFELRVGTNESIKMFTREWKGMKSDK